MKVTKTVGVLVLIGYLFAWYVAIRAVHAFIPLLAAPILLAILIALLVQLQKFMGLAPRPRQRFKEPPADDASPE